jgi:aminoglycoside phosphotransferase
VERWGSVQQRRVQQRRVQQYGPPLQRLHELPPHPCEHQKHLERQTLEHQFLRQ